MGLPEAEYHFRSAVTYGSSSIEAQDAYLPAGAFHKAMAEGMLELTLALKQIQSRLDGLAGPGGGAGPGGPGATHVGGAVLDAGVLTTDPAVPGEPAAGGQGPGGRVHDVPDRLHRTFEERRDPSS